MFFHINPAFRTRAISSSIYLNFDQNLVNFGQYLFNITTKFPNSAEKQLNSNLKNSGAECGIKAISILFLVNNSGFFHDQIFPGKFLLFQDRLFQGKKFRGVFSSRYYHFLKGKLFDFCNFFGNFFNKCRLILFASMALWSKIRTISFNKKAI